MRRAVLLVFALVVAGCSGDETAEAPAPPSSTTTSSTTAPGPTTSTTAPAPITAADTQAIYDAVTPALARADVPGVVIMVIRDGEVITSVVSGVDPATDEILHLDELFQVGSISKPVTAMAIAALVERGVLDWDDDIRAHLTSYELRSEHDAPITIAQLLSHTGGITVDGFVGYPPGAEVPSVPTLLGGGGNSPEVFAEVPPGSYSYSGGGYTLLQEALVDLSGKDFTTLLAELVLAPAGTETATFAQPLPADRRERATAASIEGAAVEPFVYPEQAAAGLWIGGPDLALLLTEFQKALRGEADWLGQEAASFLIEPTTGGAGVVLGHGFFVSDTVDPQWFWHSGRNTGFSAEIIGSVDGRHGVVVLTNALEAELTIRAIVDAVAEIEGWEGVPL